ncbi:MAG TPA: glycosyltransferase family 39 protein [Acidobacteriaceae bacterium]|jgi:hypothetical protein|nr:glycosyltransferase family 39 protein [Acidobacteriaceae bacterium]
MPVPAQISAPARARSRSTWGPALVASLLYAAISLLVLVVSYRTSDHHFIYALDDTYIGMAMAKNLALHAVWGVTPFGFSSSDSSLVFPILLAVLYRVGGVNVGAPLVLSWIFGLASIFAAQRILARFLDRKGQTLVLLLLVVFAPLFTIGVIGMEHSLHLFLTLVFLGYFLRAPGEAESRSRLWAMAAVAGLMVSARYEGLFFVAPAVCVLALERRWKPAFAIALGAAVPVCLYAAFSIAHGGYWLPNSVALKGVTGDHPSISHAVSNLIARLRDNFDEGPQMFLVLAAVGAAGAALLRRNRRAATPLLLVLAAGLLHICLAQVGMYYRYDAYLFGAATIAVACALPALREAVAKPIFAATYFLALFAGGALLLLSVSQLHMLPLVARNIYLRQWQMGRFVQRYFPTATIAANDIGAINYLSSIHCYDLVGLANQEIFFARRSGRYTTDFLRSDAAANHVQIAIAYDRWFGDPPGVPVGGPPLPSNWIRVAHWQIDDPSIIGDHVVSFYAIDLDHVQSLRTALVQFAGELPAPVHLEMH